MNKQLSLFNHPSFGSIRTLIKDGEPWFVAKDVCAALELPNQSQATSKLGDYEKGDIILNDVTGRAQEMTIIAESGLYELVFASRKKETQAFKKWVFTEVLPSIRKTGSYGSAASQYTKSSIPVKLRYTRASLELRKVISRLERGYEDVDNMTKLYDMVHDLDDIELECRKLSREIRKLKIEIEELTEARDALTHQLSRTTEDLDSWQVAYHGVCDELLVSLQKSQKVCSR